ncbi:MAG: Do family serine endopeptidase [Pseudomonadota bacterium]
MKLDRLSSAFIATLATLSLATGAGAALPATVDGQALPTLAPLVEQASPAVVNIQVRGRSQSRGNDPFREFFGMPRSQPRETRAAGSGVIVDADNGYIVTNHHVIANADRIEITLFDGRQLVAELVGSDEDTDIAVLKVDEDGLVDIQLGDSDATRVGDFVIAIGNPFGLAHTVTSGIVSALGRNGIGGGYEDFIQTDASINPGNSGGALINLAGELVGINSAIISRTGGNVGIGFAIPSNMAQGVMRQLLEFGEVRRGLLGVIIETVDPSSAEGLGLKNVTGAYVSSVTSGSAAEQAGIEVGDVITAVNGEKVDSANELRNAIGLLRSGEEVSVTTLRDGEVKRIRATLGEQNRTSFAALSELHEGLTGVTVSSNRDGEGVLVTEVEDGSAAWNSGLREGDVIVEINREPVRNTQEFRNRVSALSDTPLYIEFRRDGRRQLRRFLP